MHDAALLALRGTRTQLSSCFTVVDLLAKCATGNVILVQHRVSGEKYALSVCFAATYRRPLHRFALKIVDKTCHYRTGGVNHVPQQVPRVTRLIKVCSMCCIIGETAH